MKLICILVMIALTLKASEACCCSLWYGYINCGCNIFGCNCNYANDDFCYYSNADGLIQNRVNPHGYCELPICHSPERCSAVTGQNMLKTNSSVTDPMVIYTTLDINRGGYISADEFENSATYLKQFANYESSSQTSMDMSDLFKALDLNNNGKIEPDEIDDSLKGSIINSSREEENYKHGNIESWNRMQSSGCAKMNTRCEGPRINPTGYPANTWQTCGLWCSQTPQCEFWHYYIAGKTCLMYKENDCVFTPDEGNVAGTKDCTDGDSDLNSKSIWTDEYGLNVCFKVRTRTKAWGHEIQWNIKGAATDLTCWNDIEFDNDNKYVQRCCLPTLENEFTITCKDTYGDGWHLGYLEIEGKRYCENFANGTESIDTMPNPAKQICATVDDSQWKANVESIFEFNSQGLTDDMNVDGTFSYPNLNSGIKLKAQVKVQSFTDHTLRAQIDRIRFYTAAGPISLMNAHEILGVGEIAFSARSHGMSEFKRFLEEPMMFSEKRGMLKNLVVSRNEPECVTKIKKSLMAELEKSSASHGLTLLKKQAIVSPLQIPSQPKKVAI